MDYDTLVHSIAQFGYAALFFALWLGIVGMPIPDEIIVMTGGAVGEIGLLHSLPAFLVTYLGVISGLSLGYILGRFFGSPVLDKLRRKQKLKKHIQKSEQLLNKYGNLSLSFSYFIPVVRHIVPYLVGINKMPFRYYVLYSYTAGLVWTTIFFVIGQCAGSHVETIETTIYHYSIYAGLALAAGIYIFVILKIRKRSHA